MGKSELDILMQARKRFDEAMGADQEERVRYDEDVRFGLNEDNCQWDKGVKSEREGDSPPRPCVSINKLPEKVDQAVGEFRQLSPTVKIRPVDDQADPVKAEIIEGLIRHIEYDSNARTTYNRAYNNQLYGGRGTWRVDIVDAKNDPFVRDLKIRHIPNPLTVVIDPFSKEADYSDARYIFVTELLDEDEYKALTGEEAGQEWSVPDLWQNWKEGRSYRVAEYWWKEKEKKEYYRIYRNGSEVTVDSLGELEIALETKEVEVDRVKWCKLVSGKVIEGPVDWPGDAIPVFRADGKTSNVGGQQKSRGMVRFAREPQRLYNYYTSNLTEQIFLAPKAPYLLSAGMLGPYKEIWDLSGRKNFPYLPYAIDPLNPGSQPRREMPPQMSPAIAHELQRMDHDIMGAMGIYQAGLGDRSNEQSGRAIFARQSMGQRGGYEFIDNFGVAYTATIKAIIGLIPAIYDTERVVRIVGEDNEVGQMPINARPGSPAAMGMPEGAPVSPPREGVSDVLNDLTVGKYDVRVDIGPSYLTQRQETLAQLTELIKVAPPQLAAVAIPLIIENMDMPRAQKLKDKVKQMMEAPPPPDPKAEIEAAELQLKAQEQARKDFETQVKAILDVAKAESLERGNQMNQYIQQVQQIQEMMRMQMEGQKMQLESEQLAMQTQGGPQ